MSRLREIAISRYGDRWLTETALAIRQWDIRFRELTSPQKWLMSVDSCQWSVEFDYQNKSVLEEPMNKLDMIKALAKEIKLPGIEAGAVVNQFFNEMAASLAKGNRIDIRGLCSFHVKKYKAYTGRNPKTGQKVRVKPKKLPVFKCGKNWGNVWGQMINIQELIDILSIPSYEAKFQTAKNTSSCIICEKLIKKFRSERAKFEYENSAICQRCQDVYLSGRKKRIRLWWNKPNRNSSKNGHLSLLQKSSLHFSEQYVIMKSIGISTGFPLSREWRNLRHFFLHCHSRESGNPEFSSVNRQMKNAVICYLCSVFRPPTSDLRPLVFSLRLLSTHISQS